MSTGASEVAFFRCAKAAHRRFASEALPIGRLINQLLGWTELVAHQAAIVRDLLVERHRIMHPAACSASQQLAITQNDGFTSQGLGFGAQLNLTTQSLHDRSA